MSESTTLDRFAALFLPQVDSKFQIELSLDGETVKIHIMNTLPDLNEGFTIGEFCRTYRDEMLAAIVETGEEIQRYQICCGSLEFQKTNARNLIRALGDRDKFLALRN